MSASIESNSQIPGPARAATTGGFWHVIRKILLPLSSLRLTVVLLGLAIFIVFAGTLAQTKVDVWVAVRDYFRTAIAWVPLQYLNFPKPFIPGWPDWKGSFPFPGGWLIGTVMAVNLVAAHTVRFKAQAKGKRLLGGLAVLAVGILVTTMVILGGSGSGLQAEPTVSWTQTWTLCKLILAAAGIGLVGAGVMQNNLSADIRKLCVIGGGIVELIALTLFVLGDRVSLGDSSMRILWQLVQGGMAGVVLAVGCWLIFGKRGGVVLLHGGIGLLMFSEILVGISAEEAQMHIKEGETVNYLQDIREVELAVVDQSAPDKDTTTAIPQSRLMEPFEDTIHPFFSRSFCRKMPESLRSIFQCKKGDPLITSDELPFDVVVVDYLQNSRMGPVGGTDGKVENPATKGLGLTTQATRITASTGVKSEAVDDTSVYVEFRKKGTSESLGVYLFNMLATRFQDSRARSGWTDAEIRANTPPFLYELSKPQLLEVDGKKYDVALRFKRAYKPFSVQLTDVRFDKYIGTNTAKNYSSDVVLTDGGMSVQRHIWMNNPLRYGGETFYQSNYMQDPLTGQEATGLQVVTNTGWMIPYVSCMIVAVGMLFQFGLTLFRFLGRSARGRAVDSPADTISGKPVAQTAEPVLLPTRPGTADWILAGLAVLACVAMVIGEGFGRKTGFGDFDLEQAAKIPVVYEGRIKPIDSLARNTMQVISNHDNVPDTGSTKLTAIRWLFDVMSGASDQKDGTPRSEFHKVFRIDNPEMADFFQLEWRKSHLYSRREIAKQADRFHAEVDRLREKRGNEKEIALRTEVAKAIASEVTKDAVGDIPDAKVAGNSTEIASEIASEIENAKGNVDARLIAKLIARVIVRTDVKADAKVIAQEIARVNQKAIAKAGAGAVAGAIDREYAAAQQNFDAFERKMLDLDRRIRAYTAVEASMAVKQFPANPDAELIEAFRAQAPRVRAMVESNEQKLMKGLPPLAVPMVSSDGKHDLVEWKPLVTATERDYILAKILKQQDPSRAVALWNEILTSYAEEKPQVFNRAVRSYLDLIADTRPAEYQPAKTGFEAFYNRVAPFKIAWTLYLLAGIGTLIGWLMAVAGVGRPVQWATFIGLLVIFVLHTASLMGRMYISGRPPVTNLYSSAVFIGWGAVVAGLVLEWIFRMGIGNAVASVAGFITLYISFTLAGDGDTFTVMQAVLDTQFWLATHVVTIALGYTATFVAGTLGTLYIFHGVLTPFSTAKTRATLTSMTYGTLCCAIMLSFVGTVLGGLWADDSWGRFWGWDPKENGALIIVLWNSLVLHARWGGMVKDRGLAALAIGGNIMTAWSWFGVNELGVGLHAYGFREGTVMWLGLYALVNVIFIGLASLPTAWWWSYAAGIRPIGSLRGTPAGMKA